MIDFYKDTAAILENNTNLSVRGVLDLATE